MQLSRGEGGSRVKWEKWALESVRCILCVPLEVCALCDPLPHLKKMHNLPLRAAMRIGQSIHSFIQSLIHSPHVPCASTMCQAIFQDLRIEMHAIIEFMS